MHTQLRMLRARVENRRRLGEQRRLAKTAGKKCITARKKTKESEKKCRHNKRTALALPLPLPLLRHCHCLCLHSTSAPASSSARLCSARFIFGSPASSSLIGSFGVRRSYLGRSKQWRPDGGCFPTYVCASVCASVLGVSLLSANTG